MDSQLLPGHIRTEGHCPVCNAPVEALDIHTGMTQCINNKCKTVVLVPVWSDRNKYIENYPPYKGGV